jgi:O-succinylbenzoic acid--CoA ligase
MENSAIATGDFFGLQPGDKAIDCLPSHFIAGKMMLVRAMILGLEIDCVEPVAQPIFDYEKEYDFCAMIPLQLKNTIDYAYNIKTIIVGGSKVTKPLLKRIAQSPNRFFETYGMTETITHVAVRQIPSKEYKGNILFQALPHVQFSIDERNCLVIHAPRLVEEDLITNDIVELKDSSCFKWKGRYDNVVNSAGIKLYPEEIEDKLQGLINSRYIVTGIEDAELGEKLILIVEDPTLDATELMANIKKLPTLSKHEAPKSIILLEQFVETVNGKIQREKTLQAAINKAR